ncbi:MAG: SDR family oxidoreductase [Pseudomonadota bacterium]
MSVNGMKILVTGASSGIGEHLTRFLAASGAQVVATARRTDRLEALAADLPNITPMRMDVGDVASIEGAVARAASQMAGLDGLFNNAGISKGSPAQTTSDADWEQVIDINLNGVFRVARAVCPIMAEAGGGSIVNTASVLSNRPGIGVASYAASKAGVAHLTRSLALEWAPLKIRVNAIAPGYFPTEMTSPFLSGPKGESLSAGVPMRRFGDLRELEGPLELLMGSRGSFITGAVLPVDGGHLCQSI